ncbi:hypothetical protein F3Y22_tig00111053pilonHSYRG00136 [Hibiscus syriacus]|uniref:HAT C-terminal dimerisation domain-containing protein n=1 Tax=Hibiscus syriacus TaxID=106335 RepID=A0A6A2Z503_HIBSY|nr:hypothetical protein F3Y22_tig00111053pilonHSYRG00136 [Hibiscus syriacus]
MALGSTPIHFNQALKFRVVIQPRKISCKDMRLQKKGISALLSKINSRIALTTDMWTSSNQRKGYMAVITHFINNGWKLQSRTLRFLYASAPHTAEVLTEHLKECIHSWNIDIRLSSITVDNCTTNDSMIDIFLQEFPYGSLMLHERFLHMRCCAHILNLIVQDGLSAMIKNGLDRTRDSVAFWTASDKRNQNFEQVVPECTKKVQLDYKTRWNSTYDMLMIALNYKEVYVVLSGRESLFKNPPLNEDWEKVEKIYELLEVFNYITLVFSASKYPTANNYFPCICGLRIVMSNWLSLPCDYIRKMVLVMLEKYNKYWADVNGLMGVATILDLRYLKTGNIPLVNDFDILNWWNTNGNSFPTLQQIAKDILSISVSTVPSESAFSTNGRVIGPYRSRLLPEMIEALMCAHN